MARLGLFLIGVVAWASEQLSRNRERPLHYVLAGVAYGALAGVTAVGLAVDGLFSMPTLLRAERPRASGTATGNRSRSDEVRRSCSESSPVPFRGR